MWSNRERIAQWASRLVIPVFAGGIAVLLLFVGDAIVSDFPFLHWAGSRHDAQRLGDVWWLAEKAQESHRAFQFSDGNQPTLGVAHGRGEGAESRVSSAAGSSGGLSVELLQTATEAIRALRDWLAPRLVEVADHLGFLPLLILLAGLCRLIVLPFSLKSDRDHLALLSAGGELESLRRRLAGDPVRRGRAVRQVHRRLELSPLSGILACAGFPITLLAGAMVGQVAAVGGYVLEPFGRLSEPDPTCVLGFASAALIGLYVEWSHVRSWSQRVLVWLGLMPALTLALVLLPAAINLFAVAYVVLLLLQRAFVARLPQALVAVTARRFLDWRDRHGVVPIQRAVRDPDARSDVVRLATLTKNGFPVAPGVVLNAPLLRGWHDLREREKSRILRRVAKSLGAGPYEVRAAGGVIERGFQGAAPSSCGGLDELGIAIDDVVASFADGDVAESSAVVLQRAPLARYSGILATRAPDAAGLMMVEVGDGDLGDLVSAQVAPMRFRFGRYSNQNLSFSDTPFDMVPLLVMGRAAEALFGGPQYIEWTYDGDKLWMLACRYVGNEVTATSPMVRQEWEKVLTMASGAAAPALESLVRNAACDTLPRPTLATQSLLEALYGSGGSFDRACRRLKLDYVIAECSPPLFPSVFGRTYFNMADAEGRLPKLSARDLRRLRKYGMGHETRVRREVLPRLEARVCSAAAASFNVLSTGALLREIRAIVEGFVADMHVELDVATIVEAATTFAARREMLAAGLDLPVWIPDGGAHDVAEDLLLGLIERRGLLDYALGASTSESAGTSSVRLVERLSAAVDRAREHAVESAWGARGANRVAEVARRLQVLKSELHGLAMQELATLRRALLVLDRRFDLRNGIFLLSLDEIVALSPGDRERVRRLAVTREAERAAIASVGVLPERLSLTALEAESWSGKVGFDAQRDGHTTRVHGVRVAGSRRVGGRACVIDDDALLDGQPLSRLMPGDILVAPYIDEAWLPDLLKSSGIILRSGGWLCRTAMVARERNLALTVDVVGWSSIADGAHVTLELDGSIRVGSPRLSVANDDLVFAELP